MPSRLPRTPSPIRVDRLAQQGFEGGVRGTSALPRPVPPATRSQLNRPRTRGPGWVFDPTTFDWFIEKTATVANNNSIGLSIGAADDFGDLPYWGSSMDASFLYPAQPGLFFLQISLMATDAAAAVRVDLSGYGTWSMTLEHFEWYGWKLLIPLTAEGVSDFDYIPPPLVVNRAGANRTFALSMQVEAAVLF